MSSQEDQEYLTGKLIAYAGLSQFFRSHPNMTWGALADLATSAGYTENEAELVLWSNNIDRVNRVEERWLAIHSQRN